MMDAKYTWRSRAKPLEGLPRPKKIQHVVFRPNQRGYFSKINKNIPIKSSVGVILCRTNLITSKPEVMLVHKRVTYAFSDFVNGHYTRNDISFNISLRTLFNGMTTEELLDLLSCNFDILWYKVWLSTEKTDIYIKKSLKFHNNFIKNDGGDNLKKLVMSARPNGIVMWEVPRGRKSNHRETDVICATRELTEETGIKKNEYRFIPDIKRRISYISAGVKYKFTYYVAIANPHLYNITNLNGSSKSNMRDIKYMVEVSEIKWCDIENIRRIDDPKKHLEQLITPTFRLFKKFLKGKLLSRSTLPFTNIDYVDPTNENKNKWNVVKNFKTSRLDLLR